jgi:hypothetical protein
LKDADTSLACVDLLRVLYTLARAVASNPPRSLGQGKAGQSLGWLIARAWDGRHFPDADDDPEDIDATLELVQFVMTFSG